MKKKILALTLLSSLQLFALECTQNQYSRYFTDKKEDRYVVASLSVSDMSMIVFDKTSVKYDKKNIIQAWTIIQMKSHPSLDIMKSFVEFNIKDNTYRSLQYVAYTCEERTLGIEEGDKIWKPLIPGSNQEVVLESLKKYLKIK